MDKKTLEKSSASENKILTRLEEHLVLLEELKQAEPGSFDVRRLTKKCDGKKDYERYIKKHTERYGEINDALSSQIYSYLQELSHVLDEKNGIAISDDLRKRLLTSITKSLEDYENSDSNDRNKLNKAEDYIGKFYTQLEEKSANAQTFDFSQIKNECQQLEEILAKCRKRQEIFEDDNEFFRTYRKWYKWLKGLPFNLAHRNGEYDQITDFTTSGYNTETNQRINEIKEKYKDNQDSFIALYGDSDEDVFSDTIMEDLFSILDRSYEDKDVEFIQKCHEGLSYTLNFMLPENEDLEDVIAYAHKLLGKLSIIEEEEIVIDDNSLSEFHKNNTMKVFFTKNLNLRPEDATDADFDTRFVIGDSIKGIVFLDKMYKDKYGDHITSVTVSHGNKNSQKLLEYMTHEDFRKKFVEIYLTAGVEHYPAVKGEYPQICGIMKTLLQLPLRPTKVTVHFSDDIAATIKIDGDSEEGIDRVQYYIDDLEKQYKDGKDLPTPILKDDMLEQKIVDDLNGYPEYEFVKVSIMSKDFYSVRNEQGIQLGRGLNVVLASIDEDYGYLHYCNILQPLIGSEFGSFSFNGYQRPKEKVSREKIAKYL